MAALLCLAFSSPRIASAQPNRSARKHGVSGKVHKAGRKSVRSHKKARKSARKHNPANARRRNPSIYQDVAGRVLVERYDIPPVYGPFPVAEVQNYPQPPCEPIDAAVEVRLHEMGPEEEPPEGPAPEVAQEAAGHPPASLARIAQRVGSFFRPKSSEAVVRPQDVDLTELLSQGFLIPVEGVNPEKLQDSFLSSRGRHNKHLAIDIGAPRGTPVLATTDGEIVRITRERRGGKSIYQKDATGQYLLFYCHLSRYTDQLSAHQKVKKGEVIGYVGSTGHVIGGSHLHFSITRLPDDAGSFKRGLAINPYLLFLAGVP